jgi:RNA polymerase sigma-70 factor (ECF subfamily)
MMSSESAAYLPHVLAAAPETQKSVGPPGHYGQDLRPAAEEASTTRRCAAQPAEFAEPSDANLLNRISRGEKEALSIIFRRHSRAVFNVACRILRDESEAEDLCQEVFLYIFQRAVLFDASKGTASSWIIQVAYHRAIDRRHFLTFRRHYDAQELSDEYLSVSHHRLFVDEVVARTLLNRLREQISGEQRQTLELFFFEGYSLREIADKTGETLGNVRNHYYRGLERLRSCVFPKKDI